MKKKKGFTLLEMVIVVIIIAVITLISVPNIQKTLTIVDDKGCQALVKTVDSAILQYRLQYDDDPGSVQDLINAELLTEEQVKCDGGQTISIYDGQAQAD